jgi:chromosome partitioning protein
MFVALIGHKGGVGKTTAAIHLAAVLHQDGPTLLIDADPNRSALEWSRRGSLPFKVMGQNQAIRHIADHKHVVFDTKARLDRTELDELAAGVDLLIVPTSPDIAYLK